MDFSKILKTLREREHLTQKELANEIKVRQSIISRYENAILEPDIKTLIALADFFNVSIDELVGRDK